MTWRSGTLCKIQRDSGRPSISCQVSSLLLLHRLSNPVRLQLSVSADGHVAPQLDRHPPLAPARYEERVRDLVGLNAADNETFHAINEKMAHERKRLEEEKKRNIRLAEE